MYQKIKDIGKYLRCHKVKIYSYFNITLILFEILVFSLFAKCSWWYVLMISTRILWSWMPFFGHIKKHAKACQLWCLLESILIVIVVSVSLFKRGRMSKVGLATILVTFIFRLYGLWIIYYYSLELSNDFSVLFKKVTNSGENLAADNPFPQDPDYECTLNYAEISHHVLPPLRESKELPCNTSNNNADNSSTVQYSIIDL